MKLIPANFMDYLAKILYVPVIMLATKKIQYPRVIEEKWDASLSLILLNQKSKYKKLTL